MPYRLICSRADMEVWLVVGATREDHWLDFKGLDENGRSYAEGRKGQRECARDVAQFANAAGGTLVIGAEEDGHVLLGFRSVPRAHDLLRWIDETVKGALEPVPAIDPYVIETAGGESVIALNIPPALSLVARRSDEKYEFPIRTADARRYLRLAEVEARMQGRERMTSLRIEQIGPDKSVGLDAQIRGADHNEWRVRAVDDNVVRLSKGVLEVVVPLIYVDAVYQAGELGAEWVLSLSCFLTLGRQTHRLHLTKGLPYGARAGEYRPRGLA